MKVVLINDESLSTKRNEAYKGLAPFDFLFLSCPAVVRFARGEEHARAVEGGRRPQLDEGRRRHLRQLELHQGPLAPRPPHAFTLRQGFRYQLFCSARTVGTPSCVVWCDFPVERSREWNVAAEGGPRW